MMAPGVSGSYVDLVKRVGAATPGHAVKAIGQATEEEVVAALAAIQFPSLFLAGELDKTAPPEAIKRNADRVSGSSYAVVEGCGHYPWAESLDTFCGKVEPFLTRFR
jgi:pimeloyl-ACP methyl ester carboxylesterase